MEILGKTLSWIITIAAGIIAIGIGLWIASIPHTIKARNREKLFQKVCESRDPMSNSDFCLGCGVWEEDETTALICRNGLAECAKVDSSKIYPNDPFSITGIEYDDDVAGFTQEIGAVSHHLGYSFPMEEVDTVSDYILAVLHLQKKSSEPFTLRQRENRAQSDRPHTIL